MTEIALKDFPDLVDARGRLLCAEKDYEVKKAASEAAYTELIAAKKGYEETLGSIDAYARSIAFLRKDG